MVSERFSKGADTLWWQKPHLYLTNTPCTTLLHVEINLKSSSALGESHKGSWPHLMHADCCSSLHLLDIWFCLGFCNQSYPYIYNSAISSCSSSRSMHKNLSLSLSFFVGPSSHLYLSIETSKSPEEEHG